MAAGESRDISVSLCLQLAFDQRDSLESEVRVRTAAMDSFDRMSSSLVTSNIDLQVGEEY